MMLDFNREDLKGLLPHREEMLLLDGIQVSGPRNASGKYCFRGDEWFFRGHYPDDPVVPGVITIEIMAQTACALRREDSKGKKPYLVGVESAKFRAMIRPGEMVTTEVELREKHGVFDIADCRAISGQKHCADAVLVFLYR